MIWCYMLVWIAGVNLLSVLWGQLGLSMLENDKLTIASHCHTTTWSVAFTASIWAGKYWSTFPAPYRPIMVTLPGIRSGLTTIVSAVQEHDLPSKTRTSSAGSIVGPTLIPLTSAGIRGSTYIGLAIPLKYSTCAPSICLVLSPIQTKCAETL